MSQKRRTKDYLDSWIQQEVETGDMTQRVVGVMPPRGEVEGRRQHTKSRENRPSDRRQAQEPQASNWLHSGK